MLKNLDPLLNADLLYTLSAMGHGDEIAIVDANFPADSVARKLVRLDGVTAPRALKAVLSLMPLDDFVDYPANVMGVVGDPDAIPDPVREFGEAIDAAEGKHWDLGKVDRFAFYDRAKKAYAVVATGETRLYGCILLTKGVIRPQ